MAIIEGVELPPFDESDPDDFRPNSRWITLGDETREVGPGAVVFIPMETPHGTRNTGAEAVRIRAMFPAERLGIHDLERNPAPGTEDDPPRPPFTIDVRALPT